MTQRRKAKEADKEAEISRFFTSRNALPPKESVNTLKSPVLVNQDHESHISSCRSQFSFDIPQRSSLGLGSSGVTKSRRDRSNGILNTGRQSLPSQRRDSPTRSVSYYSWSQTRSPSQHSPVHSSTTKNFLEFSRSAGRAKSSSSEKSVNRSSVYVERLHDEQNIPVTGLDKKRESSHCKTSSPEKEISKLKAAEMIQPDQSPGARRESDRRNIDTSKDKSFQDTPTLLEPSNSTVTTCTSGARLNLDQTPDLEVKSESRVFEESLNLFDNAFEKLLQECKTTAGPQNLEFFHQSTTKMFAGVPDESRFRNEKQPYEDDSTPRALGGVGNILDHRHDQLSKHIPLKRSSSFLTHDSTARADGITKSPGYHLDEHESKPNPFTKYRPSDQLGFRHEADMEFESLLSGKALGDASISNITPCWECSVANALDEPISPESQIFRNAGYSRQDYADISSTGGTAFHKPLDENASEEFCGNLEQYHSCPLQEYRAMKVPNTQVAQGPISISTGLNPPVCTEYNDLTYDKGHHTLNRPERKYSNSASKAGEDFEESHNAHNSQHSHFASSIAKHLPQGPNPSYYVHKRSPPVRDGEVLPAEFWKPHKLY